MKAAVAAVSEVAEAGAGLVVFPETYLPGYPVWIWSLRPGGDYGLAPGAARPAAGQQRRPRRPMTSRRFRTPPPSSGVVVVCGIHERDGSATAGPRSTTPGHHRSLTARSSIGTASSCPPTRSGWCGDRATRPGLRVVDTAFGRLGGLICWENYMPLARYTLYAEGVQIYVASTWDSGDAWIATMRHIASEGRCWVIGSGCALPPATSRQTFPSREHVFNDEDAWLNPGDSVVVAPDRRGRGRAAARGARDPLRRHRRQPGRRPAPHPRRRRPLQPSRHLHPHRRPLAASAFSHPRRVVASTPCGSAGRFALMPHGERSPIVGRRTGGRRRDGRGLLPGLVRRRRRTDGAGPAPRAGQAFAREE